jgi:DNA-binding beta-propeller fold protein YncE
MSVTPLKLTSGFIANFKAGDTIANTFLDPIALFSLSVPVNSIGYDSANNRIFTANSSGIGIYNANSPFNNISNIATTAPSAICFNSWNSYLTAVNTTTPALQQFSNNSFAQIGSNTTTSATPTSICYDANNNNYGVVTSGGNNLQTFNAAYPTVTQSLSLASGSNPQSVAYDTTNDHFIIANKGQNNLQVVGYPYTQSGSTISVGEGTGVVIYDAAGNRFFVACTAGVQVYNASTYALITTLPVSNARGIAFDSANNRLFVTGYPGNVIMAFNTASYTQYGAASYAQIGSTIDTGGFPYLLDYDPVNNRIIVPFYNGGVIRVYDASSTSFPQVGSDIAGGSGPIAVDVDTINNRFFVCNAGGTVQIISSASTSFTQLGVITLSSGIANNATYDPVNNRILIAVGNTLYAAVYNGTSFAFITNIIVGTGGNTTDVIYDSTNNRYITGALNGYGNVRIYNAATYAEIDGELSSDYGVVWVAYDKANDRIIVSNGSLNTLKVYTRQLASVTTITTNSGPCAVTCDQVNGHMLVVNATANTLQGFGLTSYSSVGSAATGNNPSAIAYDATNNNIIVANKNDNTISVFTGAFSLVATIPVMPSPTSVIVANGYIFVGSSTSSAINIFIAATLAPFSYSTQIASIQSEIVSTYQLNTLIEEQIATLSTTQVTAYLTSQVTAIMSTQISALQSEILTTSQVTALVPTGLSALSIAPYNSKSFALVGTIPVLPVTWPGYSTASVEIDTYNKQIISRRYAVSGYTQLSVFSSVYPFQHLFSTYIAGTYNDGAPAYEPVNNRILVSVGGNLYIYNATSFSLTNTLTGLISPSNPIALGSGNFAMCGGSGGAVIYSGSTLSSLGTITFSGGNDRGAYDATNNHIVVVGNSGGYSAVFGASSPWSQVGSNFASGGGANSAVVDATNAHLIIANESDGTVQVNNLTSPFTLQTTLTPFYGSGSAVFVGFDATNGHILVTSPVLGLTAIYNAATYALIKIINAPGMYVPVYDSVNNHIVIAGANSILIYNGS